VVELLVVVAAKVVVVGGTYIVEDVVCAPAEDSQPATSKPSNKQLAETCQNLWSSRTFAVTI
jgi:hypothetical protein